MSNSNLGPNEHPASDSAGEPESEPPRDNRTHVSAFEPDDAPLEPERIPPATDAAQAGIVIGNENFMRVIQAFDDGEAVDQPERDEHDREHRGRVTRSGRDPSRSKLDHLSAGTGGDEGLRIGCAHWARSSASRFFTAMFQDVHAQPAALAEMVRYFGEPPGEQHWSAYLRDASMDEGTVLSADTLDQALRATLLQAAPGWLDDEDRVPRTKAHGLFSKEWFAGSIKAVLSLRAVARWQSRFWWDDVVKPAIGAAGGLGVTTVGGLASMVAIKNSWGRVPEHLTVDTEGRLVDGSRTYAWADPSGGYPHHVDQAAYLRDWHALVLWRVHVGRKHKIRGRMKRIWQYWYEDTWGPLPLLPKGHDETDDEEAAREAADAATVLEHAFEHTGTFMAEAEIRYDPDTSEPHVPPPAIRQLDEDPPPQEVTTEPHVEPLAPGEDPLLDLGFPLSFVPRESYREGRWSYEFTFESGNIHEGCDLVAPVGRAVHAVDAGDIVGCDGFYGNTYAVAVRHDAGFVGRYGQVQGLAPELHVGDRVTRGQVIAYVARLRHDQSALHFEMYGGSEVRRADLMNPTDYLAAWQRNLPEEQPAAPSEVQPCTDPCCADPGPRSRELYDAAIDELDVARNYMRQHPDGNPCTDHSCQRGDHTTHCNVFAMAAMRAMGLEDPHAPSGGANPWTEWMRNEGQQHGWYEVDEAGAIKRASLGFPTLALWEGMEGRYSGHGHVAVVRPGGRVGRPGDGEPFYFPGPTTAQAGSWNWNRGGLSGRTLYDHGPPQPLTYWTHD